MYGVIFAPYCCPISTYFYLPNQQYEMSLENPIFYLHERYTHFMIILSLANRTKDFWSQISSAQRWMSLLDGYKNTLAISSMRNKIDHVRGIYTSKLLIKTINFSIDSVQVKITMYDDVARKFNTKTTNIRTTTY